MRNYLTLVSAIGACLLTACNNDTVTTTEATESTGTGSTGSSTSTTSTSTDPSTTVLPTTDCGTGCISTTELSSSGLTTDISSTTTTDSSTGGSTDGTGGSTDGTGGSTDGTGGSTDGTGSSGGGDHCVNGMMDADETDVDCGGPTCGDCADGLLCAANDDCVSLACAGGVCVAPECTQDDQCGALDDACNSGICDLGTFTCAKQAMPDGVGCDDADLCTSNDVCTAGVCGGAAKDCAAQDTACGVGVCNPNDGMCETQPDVKKDGFACDDANGCTANTICLAGVCGDPNNKGYAFYETFADNMAGWTLGTNWEIKAAVASPDGTGGTGKDPATDHTPTMDNGVAGTLVGGLLTDANVPANQQLCLTSPKVNTAAMPTVWLTFWRHLHADYPPFATQRIEVFNGNAWQLLETGYGSPVTNDADWKEIKFDVTAHKNANMQFRICNSRTAGGSYNHGGWSVDDVTFAPVSCTP